MSRWKKNRKSKLSITKSKKSKITKKPKKTLDNKNDNKSKSSSCKDSKKTNSKDDQNQKKGNNNDITVEKTKVMCRRYEEFHDHFLNYDKILTFLEKTRKANCSAVDLIKIGNSTQGKPIYMMSITSSLCGNNNPKMAVLIEAGLNGENAIAVSNALFMIEYLTKNPNFIKIMDYFIIPCSNPDAYDDFIKSKEKKENESKKSESNHCTLTKKKSYVDISKEEKNNSKRPRCNSPKNDKTKAKKRGCKSTKSKNSYKNLETNHNNKKNNNRNSRSSLGSPTKIHKAYTQLCQKTAKEPQKSIGVDLSLNFPIILGLNDMRRIPTDAFLAKIKLWKENYINNSPETRALINAIYSYQFAIKLLISLQEDGEAICYPYGFCAGVSGETNELMNIAKKGKCGINGRNFECGSIYDIQGLTYGSLIDFLKVDKASIKYTYLIKVHKKTPRYNEKEELKQLMRYGKEVMECVKRMCCAVYKSFTDMTGNKKVEIEKTKPSLDKKFTF